MNAILNRHKSVIQVAVIYVLFLYNSSISVWHMMWVYAFYRCFNVRGVLKRRTCLMSSSHSQGPPGPPGPPGRPGFFNCPKGVSPSPTSVKDLQYALNFYQPLPNSWCWSAVLWILKAVFQIPPRPHCKTPVSDREPLAKQGRRVGVVLSLRCLPLSVPTICSLLPVCLSPLHILTIVSQSGSLLPHDQGGWKSLSPQLAMTTD